MTEHGKIVHLTAKEFSLLVALAVHIRRLREKLPAVAARIASVKPIGYRLADPGEGE